MRRIAGRGIGGRRVGGGGGGAAPAPWSIDLTSAGTFTRASEGSYRTGTETDGSSAFIAWATANVLRSENRGDGAGGLLLYEGSRTNYVLRSEEWDNTGVWTIAANRSLAGDVATAPDGASDADSVTWTSTSGASLTGQDVGAFADNAIMSFSAYARRNAGTDQDYRFEIRRKNGTFASASFTAGSVWTRAELTTDILTGASSQQMRFRNSATSGIRSYYVWGAQLEDSTARFSSSYIRTTTASATRAADTHTLTPAQVASGLLTTDGRFAQFAPYYGNTELVSGDQHWLWSIDGSSNGVRVRHNGTDVRIEAVESGSVRAQSQALSFSKHALLGAVVWKPSSGLLSVGGVDGPSGTAWTWGAPSSGLRVGGIYGGAGELYGRVSSVMEQV